MLIISEFDRLFNLVSSNCKSREDLTDVGAWLHRDNTELIFFVDPHKERLVVVMEDTTGFGPFALESAALQVSITSLKEEMILDELILLSFGHGFERVVLAFEFSGKSIKDIDNSAF